MLGDKIPKMAKQVKKLDHIDSIESQLEEMKVFGQRLDQQELRMSTIRDKLEIYSSQVQSFTEQPVVENQTQAVVETSTESIYTVVDPEDPIDVLVGATLTAEFAEINVLRQSTSLYSI